MVFHTTTFGAPGRGYLAGFSSSLARLHGSGGWTLPPRRRRGDDGGCGVIRATRLLPSCARGNRAREAAARVRAPVKGPLTSCERRSDKSQLAAFLTHVRKPAPALTARHGRSSPLRKPAPAETARHGRPSPLRRKADSGRTKPAPAESRLWSHPRLYISVSPTLRGPAGNKIFSFVTR